MSELTMAQAADEVRTLIRGIKGVEMVVVAMENVASIENAAVEATKRLDQINAEINTLTVTKTTAEAEVEEIREKGRKARDAAKSAATKTLDTATVEAAAKIADAEATVAKIKLEVEAIEAKRVELIKANEETLASTEALEKRAEAARAYLAKLAG